MSDQFTIDPEFRDLLPPLSDDEYQRLQADINMNGCRDKLVVWKEWNILIDGHNRHDICTTLDLPYETTDMSFHGRDDVKLWMIRNQLARRNITDAKRIVLHLMLKPVLAAKAKETQGARTDLLTTLSKGDPEPVQQLNTRAEIAKASGTSEGNVAKVEVVMKDADDTVKERMLAGDISINKAHKIAELPIGEQPAAVVAAMSPMRPKARDPELDLLPLTEKQEKAWGAMSEELCDRVRGYAKRYPAARSQIVSDLRKLIRSIEGK